MTQPILFTEGELFEVSDAVNKALREYLDSSDPENHEAIFGSASNLLAAIKKISAVLLGGPPPDWLKEFEQRVAALRAAQEVSPKAKRAVATAISRDAATERDGIREFHTDKPKH